MRGRLEKERDMIRDYNQPQVPSRGMLLGTCAGLSESSGMPAPAFRIATIVAACLWFKLTILAYCVGALYYRFRR
jgi:phage shock protein PspC (stress-responsive transcriptional regulator)